MKDDLGTPGRRLCFGVASPQATRAERPMANGRPPVAPQAARIRRADGRSRDRRARPQEFSATHRAKLHASESIERLNGEIKRRAEVVGVFPNEGAVVSPIGANLAEQRTIGPSSAPTT